MEIRLEDGICVNVELWLQLQHTNLFTARMVVNLSSVWEVSVPVCRWFNVHFCMFYYKIVSSLVYKIVLTGGQQILTFIWWNIDTVGSLLPDLNGAHRWLNCRKYWIMRKLIENLARKKFWIYPHILLFLIRNSRISRNRLLIPPLLWLFHDMRVSVWHARAARTIR
jgi:hypothetical protein